VDEIWAKHRPALATLGVPTDGWKRAHEEGYYRWAVEVWQEKPDGKAKE